MTKTRNEAWDAAEALLGRPGRTISGAKQGPPTVVWNANVCARSLGKVWFGDVDLARSREALHDLAVALDEPVYVLRERHARFENEANPLYDEAVEVFS